jgi:hypothetical protein
VVASSHDKHHAGCKNQATKHAASTNKQIHKCSGRFVSISNGKDRDLDTIKITSDCMFVLHLGLRSFL